MSTKMITAITVAVLCISVSAQQNSRSGTVRPQTSEPTTTAKKAVTLSGHVIDDGRILVSEDQDQWAVSNPATLGDPHRTAGDSEVPTVRRPEFNSCVVDRSCRNQVRSCAQRLCLPAIGSSAAFRARARSSLRWRVQVRSDSRPLSMPF
jgi:hypothetical protein